MASMQLIAIQAALRELGPSARGRRFPPPLIDTIRTWVAAQRRGGRPWRDISARLGLRETTLQRWCAAPTSPREPRPVVIRADHADRIEAHEAVVAPTRLIALVAPTGWRVEGLSLDQARQMLVSLGC